jgi:hypothetical protein
MVMEPRLLPRAAALEQFPAGRHCVGDAVGAAMLSRAALASNECRDVVGIFDLCSAIVAAWMFGNHR